jgi:hypothetical protein
MLCDQPRLPVASEEGILLSKGPHKKGANIYLHFLILKQNQFFLTCLITITNSGIFFFYIQKFERVTTDDARCRYYRNVVFYGEKMFKAMFPTREFISYYSAFISVITCSIKI